MHYLAYPATIKSLPKRSALAFLLLASLSKADDEDFCYGYRLPRAYGGDWGNFWGNCLATDDGSNYYIGGGTSDTDLGAASSGYDTAFMLHYDDSFDQLHALKADSNTDHFFMAHVCDADVSAGGAVSGDVAFCGSGYDFMNSYYTNMCVFWNKDTGIIGDYKLSLSGNNLDETNFSGPMQGIAGGFMYIDGFAYIGLSTGNLSGGTLWVKLDSSGTVHWATHMTLYGEAVLFFIDPVSSTIFTSAY
jgi:hypothetical protein